MEGLRDETGIFAISGSLQAAQLTVLGLRGLQHRGARGAGIAASDGHMIRAVQGHGRAEDIFSGRDLSVLRAASALGQVWGGGERADEAEVEAQVVANYPFVGRWKDGQIAVAMVGRFANGVTLRRELTASGALFSTLSDGELLLHLMARSGQQTMVNRLVDALWKVEGAFSVVLMTEDLVVAVRDPRGFRSLWAGQIGSAVGVATEDTALRLVGASELRELQPGEMLILDASGPTVVRPLKRRAISRCTMEATALAAHEATVFGKPVYPLRVKLGERLAAEAPVRADVVLGLPGSSLPAALGFSRISGVPFHAGIERTPWSDPLAPVPSGDAELVWRTVPAVVKGKRVVLVLSTLGDGQDVRRIVQLLRSTGATEVHLRVTQPALVAKCPYGVSSPTREELIAGPGTSAEGLADVLSAESVLCLERDALRPLLGGSDGPGFCEGCLGGAWPVAVETLDDQLGLFDAE
ncbi:MAG: hypothetical protein KC912_24535 [Proteobacteria bacterium]|nr:hypothetical protein [Pseudomonadota bacterium]